MSVATKTCRTCGGTGHNSRTCAVLRASTPTPATVRVPSHDDTADRLGLLLARLPGMVEDAEALRHALDRRRDASHETCVSAGQALAALQYALREYAAIERAVR